MTAFLWIALIVGGFLFGSIMFSRIIPMLIVKKDVCELSEDHNPGVANVFTNCGVAVGSLCLFLDLLKGFTTVFIACLFMDTDSILFSIVMAAPVLGHALGIFNKNHGGKCIATSFGVMLGIMPETRIGFLLAALYILFSTLIRLRPHSRRSIIAFLLFAVSSFIIMSVLNKYAIGIGCVIVSVIAIIKHAISERSVVKSKIEEEEKESENATA